MKTILLIDDEEQVRKACSIMLVRSGFRVLEAEHGRAGVALLEAEGADAVITDIVMPVQEGLETIRLIRKSHPHVRIIAMSGGGAYHGAADYLFLAEKFGAHATLNKPFNKEDLLSAVQSALQEE